MTGNPSFWNGEAAANTTTQTQLNPADNSNWDITQDLTTSALWDLGGRNPLLYRCPADARSCQAFTGKGYQFYPVVRSYSMSQVFASTSAWINNPGGNFKSYKKKTSIVYPVNTFVFIEEAPQSINDDAFAVMCGSTLAAGGEQIADFPAVYHGGKSTTLAFSDGHSEIHSWLGTAILHCTPGHFMDGPATAAGNSAVDVDWLAAHTTTQ
jgi:hypothetical protein